MLVMADNHQLIEHIIKQLSAVKCPVYDNIRDLLLGNCNDTSSVSAMR